MKVLFVSNDPQVFDRHSKVRLRVEAYARDMDHLYVLSSGKTEETQHGERLTLEPLPLFRPLALLVLPWRIRSLVIREKIDVVSAQDPFEHGLLAYIGVRGTHALLHLQLHTDPFAKGFVSWSVLGIMNWIRRILLGYTVQRAIHVRVVSTRLKQGIHTRWNEVSVRVLPVPVQEAPLIEQKQKRPHSCITVGRLTAEKNVSDIISAFAIVFHEFPDATLTVLGDGPCLGALKRQAETLGVLHAVTFIPYQREIMSLLAEHAVYVHASSYEGYGLTLIEAGLARLPIISTDVGVVGDVLKKGESVLVFDPHDIRALARHITMLFDNPLMQEQISKEAACSVSAHLASKDNAVSSIVDDLRYVLSTKSL